MTGRRIVGNLDFEGELAREVTSEHPPLPGRVVAGISALATLLRAVAREGDRLWTPRPVRPLRVLAAPGLSVPILESGPLLGLPLTGEVLAWGESPAVARLRRGSEPSHPPPHPPWDPGLPLEDLLWSLPAAPPKVASRVQHRGFALELATELGVALPGARLVASAREVEEHLGQGGASSAPGEEWILKAPLSTAGRGGIRGRGRELTTPARERAERLIHVFGTLLFEPWMERTADFGRVALVGPEGIHLLPTHRGEVERGGGFRGIGILPEGAERQLLGRDERILLEETVRAAAERMRGLGYRGPFNVDAWRYRDARGQTRFHSLGEINARMSFGLVAQAFAERLRGAGRMPPGRGARLRVSIGATRAPESAGSIVPLLVPAKAEPGAAWLELE